VTVFVPRSESFALVPSRSPCARRVTIRCQSLTFRGSEGVRSVFRVLLSSTDCVAESVVRGRQGRPRRRPSCRRSQLHGVASALAAHGNCRKNENLAIVMSAPVPRLRQDYAAPRAWFRLVSGVRSGQQHVFAIHFNAAQRRTTLSSHPLSGAHRVHRPARSILPFERPLRNRRGKLLCVDDRPPVRQDARPLADRPRSQSPPDSPAGDSDHAKPLPTS